MHSESSMRCFVIVLFGCLSAVGLHGQGRIWFSTTSAAPVANGLTGELVPAGTTFSAGLYYAPDGISEEALFIQIGDSAGFAGPGVFSDGIRTTPTTTAPGDY